MERKTVELARVGKFIPPHVAGDADFWGHGPRSQVQVRLTIQNSREIWAAIDMRAEETAGDRTLAEGRAVYQVYRHPTPIARILSDTYSEIDYTHPSGNHSDHRVTLPSNECVKSFILTGDTDGPEAGTRTGVTVFFNPCEIEVSA